MKRMLSTAAAAGLLLGAPAFTQTNYMNDCERLIAAWEACRTAGQSRCIAEEERIIEECRCHERQGDEWLFTRGDPSSGVCNDPDAPTITPPPPPPPERPDNIDQPRQPGPGGDDETRNGGDDPDDGAGRRGGHSSSAASEPRGSGPDR